MNVVTHATLEMNGIMAHHMWLDQISSARCKAARRKGTVEQETRSMNHHMTVQIVLLSERHAALIALVWPNACNTLNKLKYEKQYRMYACCVLSSSQHTSWNDLLDDKND